MTVKKKNTLFGRYPSCDLLNNALRFLREGKTDVAVEEIIFNYAIIFLPNGDKIEGEVTSWNDYEQSDMIQVKMDGVTYLTHSSNVILEAR